MNAADMFDPYTGEFLGDDTGAMYWPVGALSYYPTGAARDHRRRPPMGQAPRPRGVAPRPRGPGMAAPSMPPMMPGAANAIAAHNLQLRAQLMQLQQEGMLRGQTADLETAILQAQYGTVGLPAGMAGQAALSQAAAVAASAADPIPQIANNSPILGPGQWIADIPFSSDAVPAATTVDIPVLPQCDVWGFKLIVSTPTGFDIIDLKLGNSSINPVTGAIRADSYAPSAQDGRFFTFPRWSPARSQVVLTVRNTGAAPANFDASVQSVCRNRIS